MPHLVKLRSLITTVFPDCVSQQDAAKVVHEGFSTRFEESERQAKVFESSGILQRCFGCRLDWYLKPFGWAERNGASLDGSCALFVEAAAQALAYAGLSTADVDTVATVSATGLATPGIFARVPERLGFRNDVERVPVFGFGCAGGVSGMGLGSRLAQSRPGSCVLVVAVELWSVAFRLDKLTKENIVATALFDDGAAACVLRAQNGGLDGVAYSGHHTSPGTLGIMRWSVDDTGLGVIFDRAIPLFAEANLHPAVAGILARHDLGVGDVDRFCCHLGGAMVITALERALSLDRGGLDHQRTALADHGNMSAPTALIVLDRLIKVGLPARTVLTAMGPQFSASCCSLQAAA